MKNLRIRRLEKELTCESLGQLVHVKKAAISKYELNQAQPSREVLIRLAEVLECTVDFLLDLTDDPAPISAPKTLDEKRAEVEEIMNAKNGLYFRMAKTAKEIDLDEETIDFILEVYARGKGKKG